MGLALVLSLTLSNSCTENSLLESIFQVECGGRQSCPDGDGGRSIGPFQICSSYWADAVQFDPSIGGSYEDCRDRGYAERIVGAYMRRYVPGAWEVGDAEVIARTHNGGPRGAQRAGTRSYWDKVREELCRIRTVLSIEAFCQFVAGPVALPPGRAKPSVSLVNPLSWGPALDLPVRRFQRKG